MPTESTEERKLRLYREGIAQYEPDDIWAADVRAHAVAACSLCDDDGYRGMSVCDHTDHSGAAARGMAKAREVLAEIKARRGGE